MKLTLKTQQNHCGRSITDDRIYERGVTEQSEVKKYPLVSAALKAKASHETLVSSCLCDLSRAFNSTATLQTDGRTNHE